MFLHDWECVPYTHESHTEKDFRSPGSRIIKNEKPPNLIVGNGTQVIPQKNMCCVTDQDP